MELKNQDKLKHLLFRDVEILEGDDTWNLGYLWRTGEEVG
jgi:hypothetical protein